MYYAIITTATVSSSAVRTDMTTDNYTIRYTVKPFNLAATKVGDLACKIILAPFVLAN